MFVVESRETPVAAWQPWPHLAPFAHREDAIIQQVHLAARQPAPTRFASVVREFRVTEAPAGCPSCLQGAVGPTCAWHRVMAERGAAVPPPRPLEPAKPVVLSPRPRRSARAGYSGAAVAILRRHHNGGAE